MEKLFIRLFVVVAFSIFMIIGYDQVQFFGFSHTANLFVISLVFLSCVAWIFYDSARNDYKKPEMWGKAIPKSRKEKEFARYGMELKTEIIPGNTTFAKGRIPHNKGKKLTDEQRKTRNEKMNQKKLEKAAQEARIAKTAKESKERKEHKKVSATAKTGKWSTRGKTSKARVRKVVAK